MIYDIILILIFLLFIIICFSRGAAKSLAGILSAAVSYFAAAFLGKLASIWAYDGILKPAIDKAILNALKNFSTDSVDKIMDASPAWLSALLKTSGLDFASIIENNLSSPAEAISKAVDSAVRPVAEGILACFFTIVLFIIILLLVRLLVVKPVLMMFELPGLSLVNRLLGGLIGFAYAFLVVSLLAYLLNLLLPNIKSNAGILNESTIYNSFIFYHFYSGNIFTAVLSWFGI